MDSEAVATNWERREPLPLTRLEWALWMLIMLQACMLVAAVVATTWIYAWGKDLDVDTGIIAASLGGA